MQPNLVRISSWLTYTLLGLAAGWLIFGKALAPGGRPLRLSKDPGALPPKEREISLTAKARLGERDSGPLLGVSRADKPADETEFTTVSSATAKQQRRLPGAALAAAGLTEADRPKAEAILDEAWKQMEQALASRARRLSEAEAIHTEPTYFIPADQAAGDAVLVQMRKQLQEAFGKESTAAMLEAMHLEDYFASFGRKDVKIHILPTKDSSLIQLTFSNPADSRLLEMTALRPDEFERRFGRVIPLPEKEGSR